MTMPHLMNCGHSDDSWCLECVREEWERNQKIINAHECDRVAQRHSQAVDRITIADQKAEVERLRARNGRLVEALEALVDVQNGPPLLAWGKAWNDAMRAAEDAVLETKP